MSLVVRKNEVKKELEENDSVDEKELEEEKEVIEGKMVGKMKKYRVFLMILLAMLFSKEKMET